MNFDDLSRRWQQQATAVSSAPTAAAELQTLLAGPDHSPVAQMRRNAWTDLLGGLLIGGPITGAALAFGWLPSPWLTAAVLLVAGASGYYYFRKLRLLRALAGPSDPNAALRGQAARTLGELRRLVNTYYRLNLLLGLVVIGLTLWGVAGHVQAIGPALASGRFWLWLGGTALVSVVLTHFLLRWHLHHSYGRHLIRLETVLRELADEA
ncbi:hypothetical protein [Hymenobacter sp. B81]|uniref:hypothetical protein n=1 Tax=Hymenobacter sp. B81 TaxID=3344878 RepID=UPI0037DD5BC9